MRRCWLSSEVMTTAPLFQDLPRRLVRAIEAGSPAREAARRFEVSASAAIKLVRRVRETGNTARPGSAALARHCWQAMRRCCAS